ncbi:exodeoxyribonuclease 1 [Mycena galericulata]|nr:exodeoxyribonuclease 1 [Mycena galericulata]
MGISGLLPALKSISNQKHLSEFAGQTLAVDAYVWLHRGVFTCATELATGKDTHKYVDYAMHRVRLLRHHKVEPYIVFDGGPLPAKKGTEVDRQARRAEHLALGNALAAQGKTSQAREHYVKCVDVTPQMAFQFIKALRAESVPYVVAPYEADAQLAHLERVGLVDGIITEDSDLLLFGCRTVLFKMDAVSSTVVCIDRADFARVSPADGVTLTGWSDTQFRAMGILSGCDYLPSIPGIGLKTACALLRKWKTVEQALRAVAMEGKKAVPRNYLRSFRLAEKCFLHQRVYCPLQQKLVHLSPPDADWDAEADTYVGADLEPALAKMLGEGDLDPVTLLPMADINPRYVPRVLKPLPFIANGASRPGKDKGKGKATILNFFSTAGNPKAKIASPPKATKPSMIVGKQSGKRSLAAEMDRDLAAKRKKHDPPPSTTQSRFFAASRPSDNALCAEVDAYPVAGPSRPEKENLPLVDLDVGDDDLGVEGSDLDADLEWDSLSLVALPERDPMVDIEEPDDGVEQEEGYISPTPSRTRDSEDLSSPLRPNVTPPPRKRVKTERVVYEADLEVDAVSSPPEEARGRHVRLPALSLCRSPNPNGAILVAASPDPPRTVLVGPDLRDAFGDERTSDIDCFDDEDEMPGASGSTPTPTPSPLTPEDEVRGGLALGLVDPEELEAQASAARTEAVAAGWRHMWANPGKTKGSSGRETPVLRRRETNVTPAGRHLPVNNAHLRAHPYLHDAASTSALSKQPAGGRTKPLQSRRSLTFMDPVPPKASRGRASDALLSGDDGGDAIARAQIRLAQFRCP